MCQTLKKIGESRTNPTAMYGLSFGIFVVVGLALVTILSVLERNSVQVRWEDDPLKVATCCIIIVLLHELSHFVAYYKIAKVDLKDIFVGFDRRWLVLFCGCKVPITVIDQRKALIVPLIATGSACTFVFCLSLSYWSAIALSFTFGICAKDLVDFVKLRKFNRDCIITGCPGSFGVNYIFARLH